MTNSAAPACLTREEVSCLKTALALVVVKRRLQARREQEQSQSQSQSFPSSADNDDESASNQQHRETTLPKLSLHPWLPSSSNNSLLQNSIIPPSTITRHLDPMMQLALTTGDDRRRAAVITHIRTQLQASTDDILVQKWIRKQLTRLVVWCNYLETENATTTSGHVWEQILLGNNNTNKQQQQQMVLPRPPSSGAVDLLIIVWEELIAMLETILSEGVESQEAVVEDQTLDTYSLFRVMTACCVSLQSWNRLDALQSGLLTLTDWAVPLPLSVMYEQHDMSLPMVWLRMGLQQLLMEYMVCGEEYEE
jgi:hypothetical protein